MLTAAGLNPLGDQCRWARQRRRYQGVYGGKYLFSLSAKWIEFKAGLWVICGLNLCRINNDPLSSGPQQ